MQTTILIQKFGANMVKHVQKDTSSHNASRGTRRRRPFSNVFRSLRSKLHYFLILCPLVLNVLLFPHLKLKSKL